MIPIPNSNVSFGQATQMSQNDINRLNRLYQCCEYLKMSAISTLNLRNNMEMLFDCELIILFLTVQRLMSAPEVLSSLSPPDRTALGLAG